MPLRMCLAHPIALAALAVLAIGLISYNIITNKKRKIPVRERRIEYVENYETESVSRENPSGVRKRHNANTEIKKPKSEKSESQKKDNRSEEFRNQTSACSNRTHPDFSRGPTVLKEGSFNDLDSMNQNTDENGKILNIVQNINQEDSEKLDIAKTVIDDDAQSSISTVSGTTNLSKVSSISEDLNSKDDPEAKISEKLYRREVSERLKNEVETMSLSSHADSLQSENDDEDDLCNLRDLNDAVERPVICKGCEESYANAVAYPCGHRYLCLDCAIKVHRIYQKCTVCNFHIETYDIFNTREM